MRKRIFSFLLFFLSFLPPLYGKSTLSLGYGFGFLNPKAKPFYLTSRMPYKFFNFTYGKEIEVQKDTYLCFEGFLLYQKRPKEGLDGGLSFYLKLFERQKLFFTIGTGLSYTTTDFKEQGTHLLFILQGGIGYRWKVFFIEDRFRHYSNGGLSKPNRSINANLVSVGFYF